MRPFVSSLRKGFTLPEVLVTVAVVSVLAAAVVPAVVNQVAKGDGPALQADFNAIRSAIGTFTTDVKRYPRTMTNLAQTAAITSGDDDIYGNDYGVGSANFHGPYLSSKATLSSTVLYKTASFSLSISDLLTIVDGHIAVTILPASGTGQISISDASSIKNVIDGTGYAATPASLSGQVTGQACAVNGTSGFVRIAGPTSNLGTVSNSGANSGTDGTCSALSGTITSVKVLLVQIGS